MTKPRIVLFVCLGNICRSPMAEELFRRLDFGGGFPVRFGVEQIDVLGRPVAVQNDMNKNSPLAGHP